MTTIEKTAAQHAADAAVSHGDALAYHAEGNAADATYSARECRERVQRCHAAAAREGTREAREAALQAAGLLMTLPNHVRAKRRNTETTARFITVLAVLEVPPQVLERSDEDLLQDASKALGDGWPTHEDAGRFCAELSFLTVGRGVSLAAQDAGAEAREAVFFGLPLLAVLSRLLEGNQERDRAEKS